MKTLNILFGIIGLSFLFFGIAFLTMNEPTPETEYYFFTSFFLGMVSTLFFIITDKIINRKN